MNKQTSKTRVYNISKEMLKGHTVAPILNPEINQVELEIVYSGEEIAYIHSSSDRCYICGFSIIYSLSKDNVFEIDTVTCPVSEIKPIESIITVKSGKMVYSDSLYHDNLSPFETDVSINYFYGMQKLIHEESIVNNIAYGYTGNTDPSVYINKNKDRIVIANNYDETCDKKECLNYNNDNYSFVGTIITDLWAYSFKDYDEYLKTEPTNGLKDSYRKPATTTVDVQSGTWLFKNYSAQPYPYFDMESEDKTIIYGEARLIKD